MNYMNSLHGNVEQISCQNVLVPKVAVLLPKDLINCGMHKPAPILVNYPQKQPWDKISWTIQVT